jgi:hypothetical protein
MGRYITKEAGSVTTNSVEKASECPSPKSAKRVSAMTNTTYAPPHQRQRGGSSALILRSSHAP